MANSPPRPSGRVLPTLNNDGTRRWVRPKLFKGRYYRRRLVVAWGLIALFVVLPFVKVGGSPAVLLDVPARRFHLLGATLLPTDGLLLMLALLSLFVFIFWLTALLGRVWCGWACPQTLYLEFLFRPLEQWLEGSRGQQLKLDEEGANGRRMLKLAIYAVLAVLLANVFLSYFVGVHRLRQWLVASPLDQPVPFLVVAITSALIFFDFAYFREQMCTIICPYARLQSVLLDPKSLLVGYDQKRGEPRGRGRSSGGDCIDCKACVIACPTGIDIRNGLQLECVACTQCIDACDQVMDKLHKPRGLIRYSTEERLTGIAKKGGRPRIFIYPVVLLVLVTGLVVFGSVTQHAQVVVLRGLGAPFLQVSGKVQNQIRIKVHNRSTNDKAFHIALKNAGDSELVVPQNPLEVPAGQQVTTTAFVTSERGLFKSGVRPVDVVVTDDDGDVQRVHYKLLGPY